MTIKQAIAWAQNQLKVANLPNIDLDITILLSHVLQQTRIFVLSHPEEELNTKQIQHFTELIAKRVQYWPIAYLTNHQEFYGLDLVVNPDVLIPRPETELIIDEILQNKDKFNEQTTMLDIGTGSGCIIITLAKHLQHITKHFLAIDISSPALTIAKQNAKTHQVSINFLIGNLLQPILDQPNLIINDLIITANLPYLDKDWPKLLTSPDSASLQYEPPQALTDHADGLTYYRQLARQIERLQTIKPQLNIKLYCEIGQGQSELFKQIFPHQKIVIKKDLANIDRLAIVNYRQ